MYMYYDKLDELKSILENYSNNHPTYINAHKYLFDFKLTHMNELDIKLIQRIGELSPIDSYILNYCKYFNDPILIIDCLFEILDAYQWKYDKDCWNFFNKSLLKISKKLVFV